MHENHAKCMTLDRPAKENQLGILKIYAFCQKIQRKTSSPGECCWCYISIYENAPQNCCIFPLKVATTLLSGSRKGTTEYSSHIVKVGVEATCKHFKPWHILKELTEPAGPFGTMPQKPCHPGKGAKLDQVIQLNCREVHTHASYKTTRTWENFDNRRTKMILLSDKL